MSAVKFSSPNVARRGRRVRNNFGNGFCYVQLFKDVLGKSLNVRETKRIFGSYPKISHVCLHLAKLAQSDCYVHDVTPTGFSTYHVNPHELVLLSTLVMRFMFSQALIGGNGVYDAAEDAAIGQSNYARRLAALASIGSESASEMLRTAAGVVVRKELASVDSPLVRFVQDSAMETLTKTNRKISLPYRLQPLELTSMQADYPEYTLINKSNKAHPHAVAGNLRILSMEVLLDSINYRKNSSPLYGENCFVVDVGGDYLSHVKMGRLNVHSDTPVLTARDSARETSRHLTLADMVRKGTLTERSYHNYVGATGPCKQRCKLKAQDCTVTATYMIINHAEYDITREDFAEALDSHAPRMAVSAMHFDPRIFTRDCFTIDALKARVVIGGGLIHFDFAGDSSFSYTHDFANYVATVTATTLVTPRGRCYLVERVGIRGATLFLRYTLCDVEPENKCERLRFCFWVPEYNITKNQEGNTVKIADIKILKVEKNSPRILYYKTSYSEEEFKKIKKYDCPTGKHEP